MRRRELLALGMAAFGARGSAAIVERNGKRLGLITHARRDALPAGLENCDLVVAPVDEAPAFERPEAFWQPFLKARYHDYAMLNAKAPARPFRVGRKVSPGERFDFEGQEFEVLATPGPTRSAVSYLTEDAGRRTVFCGDLILDGGRLLDLWSLQDAVPEAKLRGYHGYAARAGELIASLRAIVARRPDRLVPARGPVISQPSQAVERLTGELKTVLREHFATDALRWYFGDDNWRLRASKLLEGEVPYAMPMAETRPLPSWIHAMGNSRLLISESKAAFLLDSGYDKVMDEIAQLKRDGAISGLQGVFVTHYHDDHTDRAQKTASTFDCPLYYQSRIRPILESPSAFYMPCLTTEPIRTGTPQADGARLRWQEFDLTFHDFPGQTYYHSALFVRRSPSESVLFVGDSFTPSGLDDYCLRNRNFLAPATGYFRCLDLLRALPRDSFLINQHVNPMFRFDPEQLGFMERSLVRRRDALARLTIYPHFDFALDDQWVRISPYESPLGQEVRLTAHVMNHAPAALPFSLRPALPPGWRSDKREYALTLPPSAESSVEVMLRPPPDARALQVVTFDVSLNGLEFREFAEALIAPRA